MEKIKVGITVENNVEIPKYMTEGAAGIDVSANIEKEIELGVIEEETTWISISEITLNPLSEEEIKGLIC